MKRRDFIATGLLACLILPGIAAAQAERTSEIVAYDDVRIEVIAEGSGPLVILLASRGRASGDFDEVAAGIALLYTNKQRREAQAEESRETHYQ